MLLSCRAMKIIHKLFRTPAALRGLVQAAFTLFCLYVGWTFFWFVSWARGASPDFVPRPPAVEAFLPISALMGLKRLVMTGQWDPVHPAGLAILVAALVMSWLFRKGFCAYVCPVGFISGLLEKLGRRIGLARTPPRWLAVPLHGLKYLLLGFFLYTTFFGMSLFAAERFMRSSYNITADARMLDFFVHPSAAALAVLGALLVLCIVWRNFWCRFLCPYGALLGLAAFFSPLGVRRDPATCVDCGRCSQACPMGIPVHERISVGSPECIGCAECVGACPVPDCLNVSAGRRRLPFWIVVAGCVAVLLGVWIVARVTGHWDAAMPQDMLRRMYSMPAAGF